MKKILLAYDDSASARRALQAVGSLAAIGPEVVIVTVLMGTALDAEGEPMKPDPEEVEQTEKALAHARSVAASAELTARTEILVGDPKQAILKKALQERAGLIVTGCRGHGLAKRLVFGSVSTVLLHEAECPVMVVK